MLTLTVFAVVALAAASIYATCKAWSAACRLDPLSWMCWSQIGTGVGEILSALIRSAIDE